MPLVWLLIISHALVISLLAQSSANLGANKATSKAIHYLQFFYLGNIKQPEIRERWQQPQSLQRNTLVASRKKNT